VKKRREKSRGFSRGRKIYPPSFGGKELGNMVTPMTEITDRVVADLLEDPRTKNARIDVGCTQNVCTLSGTVKSEAIREAAEEIARRQPGVVTVINELKVT
jgi:osmotically-inducible protein OsmY